jgi:hypothetical protein
MAVLFGLAPLVVAAFAHAELAPGSRTERPIALVGGMLLDGNPLDEIKAMKRVLVTFRDGVPWFDPMGATVPGVEEVGRPY